MTTNIIISIAVDRLLTLIFSQTYIAEPRSLETRTAHGLTRMLRTDCDLLLCTRSGKEPRNIEDRLADLAAAAHECTKIPNIFRMLLSWHECASVIIYSKDIKSRIAAFAAEGRYKCVFNG